jgi:hypothetical protein
MKFSTQSLGEIIGVKAIARHKAKPNHHLEEQFENPIIYKQIKGDKVYVSLNLNRAWNQV